MRLTRLELSLAALAAVLLGIVLALFAPGGPISSDIVWYANLGLTGAQDPFVLNRYFHIFLQSLFLRLSPTPLVGIQAFWAFQVAAISFLVYLNARLWLAKSNPLHGLLAVGIYLSLHTFAEWTGVPWADLTAALMVMLMVTVYFFSTRRHHASRALVMTLGLLAYLALRTKETALIAFVLLPGLGFVGEEQFEWKALLKNIGYLLLGGLAGVVLLGLLNWTLVGDPFFGLRRAEFGEFFSSYIVNTNLAAEYPASSENWYTGFLLGALAIPFLLYLISGLKAAPDMTRPRRPVWLIPLAGALFMIATVNNRWGFESRFLHPAYPVMAFLAVQFLALEFPETKVERYRYLLFAGLSLLIPVALRFGLRPVVYRAGLDFGQWLEIIFHPVLLTILLAALFLAKRPTHWPAWVALACTAGLLVSPLLANARSMFVERPLQALSQFDYYPFAAFEAKIHPTTQMHLLVSPGIPQLIERRGSQSTSMLADDRNELASMFNIYFDTRLAAANFSLASADADLGLLLQRGNFDYVLLTNAEWQALSADPLLLDQVEVRYEFFTEGGGQVVLLVAR